MAYAADGILQQVLESVADVREALTQERKERVAAQASFESSVDLKQRGHTTQLNGLSGKVEALEVGAAKLEAGMPWLGEVETMRREMHAMAMRLQEMEARHDPLQRHNARYIEEIEHQLQGLREQAAADRVRSEQQIVALSEAIERGLDGSDAALAEGFDELRRSLTTPPFGGDAAASKTSTATPIATPRGGGVMPTRAISCPSPAVTHAYAPGGGNGAAASRAKGVSDAILSTVTAQCERALNPLKREIYDALRQELGATVDVARQEIDAMVRGAAPGDALYTAPLRGPTVSGGSPLSVAGGAGGAQGLLAALEGKVAALEQELATQADLLANVDDAFQSSKVRAQNDFNFFEERINEVSNTFVALDGRVGGDMAHVMERLDFLDEAHANTEAAMTAHAAALSDLDKTMQEAHASVIDITAAVDRVGSDLAGQAQRADDMQRGWAEFAADVERATAAQVAALDERSAAQRQEMAAGIAADVAAAGKRADLIEAKLETELTEVSARFADCQTLVGEVEQAAQTRYNNVDEYIATLDDGLRAVEGILEKHHSELIAVSTVLSAEAAANATVNAPLSEAGTAPSSRPGVGASGTPIYRPAHVGDDALASNASLLQFQRFHEAREDNIQKYCERRFGEITERVDSMDREVQEILSERLEFVIRENEGRMKQHVDVTAQKLQALERSHAVSAEHIATLQNEMFTNMTTLTRQVDDKIQASAATTRATIDAVKAAMAQASQDHAQAAREQSDAVDHVQREAQELQHRLDRYDATMKQLQTTHADLETAQRDAGKHVTAQLADVQSACAAARIKVEQVAVEVEELREGEVAAIKRRAEKNKAAVAQLQVGLENVESAVQDVHLEQAQDNTEKLKQRTTVADLQRAVAVLESSMHDVQHGALIGQAPAATPAATAALERRVGELETAIQAVRTEQAQDIAETEEKLRALIDGIEPALQAAENNDGGAGGVPQDMAARLAAMEEKIKECVVSVTDLEQLAVDSEGRTASTAHDLQARVHALEATAQEQHESTNMQMQEVAATVEQLEQMHLELEPRVATVEDELVQLPDKVADELGRLHAGAADIQAAQDIKMDRLSGRIDDIEEAVIDRDRLDTAQKLEGHASSEGGGGGGSTAGSPMRDNFNFSKRLGDLEASTKLSLTTLERSLQADIDALARHQASHLAASQHQSDALENVQQAVLVTAQDVDRLWDIAASGPKPATPPRVALASRTEVMQMSAPVPRPPPLALPPRPQGGAEGGASPLAAPAGGGYRDEIAGRIGSPRRHSNAPGSPTPGSGSNNPSFSSRPPQSPSRVSASSLRDRLEAIRQQSPLRVRPGDDGGQQHTTSPSGMGRGGRRPLRERIDSIDQQQQAAASNTNSSRPTSPVGSAAGSRLKDVIDALSSPRRQQAQDAAAVTTPLSPGTKKRVNFAEQTAKANHGAIEALQDKVDALSDEVQRLRRADVRGTSSRGELREKLDRLEQAVAGGHGAGHNPPHGGGGRYVGGRHTPSPAAGGAAGVPPALQAQMREDLAKVEAELRALRTMVQTGDDLAGEMRVLRKRVELVEDALFRMGAFANHPGAAAATSNPTSIPRSVRAAAAAVSSAGHGLTSPSARERDLRASVAHSPLVRHLPDTTVGGAGAGPRMASPGSAVSPRRNRAPHNLSAMVLGHVQAGITATRAASRSPHHPAPGTAAPQPTLYAPSVSRHSSVVGAGAYLHAPVPTYPQSPSAARRINPYDPTSPVSPTSPMGADYMAGILDSPRV